MNDGSLHMFAGHSLTRAPCRFITMTPVTAAAATAAPPVDRDLRPGRVALELDREAPRPRLDLLQELLDLGANGAVRRQIVPERAQVLGRLDDVAHVRERGREVEPNGGGRAKHVRSPEP